MDARRYHPMILAAGDRRVSTGTSPLPPSIGTFSGAATTVYLESGEFDRVYHLLQTEAPLFFSALNLFGLRAFSLSTSTELPGEGPADDDALAQVAARARRHVADSKAPEPGK